MNRLIREDVEIYVLDGAIVDTMQVMHALLLSTKVSRACQK